MTELLSNRHLLGKAPRVVIKVGSSSLTAPDGSLDHEQLDYLVDVIGAAVGRGQQVVLVSSGAIAAGIAPLGFTSRPSDVRDQQAAAMVGQSRLMAAYSAAFARYGITIGQVLLTVDDIENRRHYAYAQNALERLLQLGVVPIVNENDAVATDAIRFGDNDRVAALISNLVDATALILCTDVSGLYTASPSTPGARMISEVSRMDDLAALDITGKGSDVGTGGMRTKVRAAEIATSGGIAALITSTGNLHRALDGEEVGTWFLPRGRRTSARNLWLRHAATVSGRVFVDDGAARALRHGGASLLAVGVTGVDGSFGAGDLVAVYHEANEIGRGLVAFADKEILRFIPDEEGVVQRRAPRPIVHVDDLVLT